MSKKIIRLMAVSVVEIETELPVETAIAEFYENGENRFVGTENVKVIQTEWREAEKLSVLSNI